MAFGLKPEESLRKSVRRIARKEMDYAQAQVTMTANGTRDAAVHEARKSGKKLRALLRLVRPALARLTVARKIAAITLAVWKKGARFDPELVMPHAA